ncbi:hypothetical protein V6N11_050982 [Hibiscus sabdariffa]|uniref:DUF4283 domain-containing protein n=1 Tax=Hibiscus sabdariffa TaxID=183260 RepID=A0ABR2R2Y6_9ROSI
MEVFLVLSGWWRRRMRYRNQFWRRRRDVAEAGVKAPEVKRVASTVSLVAPIRRVDGVVSMTSLEVLGRCLLGRCRHPISNSNLVAALRVEKFEGVRVLRMSGSSVLLIFYNIESRRKVKERDVLSTWFDRVSEWCEDGSSLENRRVWVSVFGVPVHAWTSETFERVVAQWGTEIRVAEETMVFPVRITEADTFLRGSRLGCDCHVSDCESQNTNEDECNILVVEDHMGHFEEVSWCGNALWEVVPVAHSPVQPVLDTDLDLVPVPIEEGVIEGLDSNVIGPAVEASKVEVINFKGSRRKVRMLADVIQSVSTLAEREERKKVLKGRGRQRTGFWLFGGGGYIFK